MSGVRLLPPLLTIVIIITRIHALTVFNSRVQTWGQWIYDEDTGTLTSNYTDVVTSKYEVFWRWGCWKFDVDTQNLEAYNIDMSNENTLRNETVDWHSDYEKQSPYNPLWIRFHECVKQNMIVIQLMEYQITVNTEWATHRYPLSSRDRFMMIPVHPRNATLGVMWPIQVDITEGEMFIDFGCGLSPQMDLWLQDPNWRSYNIRRMDPTVSIWDGTCYHWTRSVFRAQCEFQLQIGADFQIIPDLQDRYWTWWIQLPSHTLFERTLFTSTSSSSRLALTPIILDPEVHAIDPLVCLIYDEMYDNQRKQKDTEEQNINYAVNYWKLRIRTTDLMAFIWFYFCFAISYGLRKHQTFGRHPYIMIVIWVFMLFMAAACHQYVNTESWILSTVLATALTWIITLTHLLLALGCQDLFTSPELPLPKRGYQYTHSIVFTVSINIIVISISYIFQ